MHYIKLLLLTFLLVSCGIKQDIAYVCDCDQRAEIMFFVSDNIEKANNMSDEEMEDVIKELKLAGIHVICEQEIIWEDHYGFIILDSLRLDSCESILLH